MSKLATLASLEVFRRVFLAGEVATLYVSETIFVKIEYTIKILMSKLQRTSLSKRFKELQQSKLINLDVCRDTSGLDGIVLQRSS